MKKKITPAALTPAADRSLKKIALIASVLPLAAEFLILFPLIQIVSANLGDGVLYQILAVTSRMLNLAGFFGAIALSVYCVFADALSALGRVFALQSIFRLLAEVGLRTFLLWLLALINDSLRPSVALSNYTLNSLTENNATELFASALYDFLSVVTMIVLLAIIIFAALIIRKKQGSQPSLDTLADPEAPACRGITSSLRIATVIYLLQALANQIYNTVVLVSGVDTEQLIESLAIIISPYFLLAIYAFAGYWFMLFISQRLAVRTLSVCRSAPDGQ